MRYGRMNSRIRRASLAILFSLFVIPAWSEDSGIPDTIPECEGKGCNFVAVEAPWPKAAKGKMVDLVTPYFKLKVPANPVHIGSSGKPWLLNIKYGDGRKRIGFGDTKKGDSKDDEYITKSTTFKIIDIPRVLFTATPNDPRPDDPKDRRAWDILLAVKGATLEKAKAGRILRNGPLTIYFVEWPENHSFYQHSVTVTDSRRPDQMVDIHFESWPTTDVLNTLSTLQPKPNQPGN